MTNQAIIKISIVAILATGKSVDEKFAAYGLVKTAHETGDYAALLGQCTEIEVKTESKTRRVEDAPKPTPEQIAAAAAQAAALAAGIVLTPVAPEGGPAAAQEPATPPADASQSPTDKPSLAPPAKSTKRTAKEILETA